jgi:hypothetical protein
MRGRGPGEELRPAISPMQSRSGGRTQLSEGLLMQDQGINVEEDDGRRGTLGALREIAYEILWHKDDASEYRLDQHNPRILHIVDILLSRLSHEQCGRGFFRQTLQTHFTAPNQPGLLNLNLSPINPYIHTSMN